MRGARGGDWLGPLALGAIAIGALACRNMSPTRAEVAPSSAVAPVTTVDPAERGTPEDVSGSRPCDRRANALAAYDAIEPGVVFSIVLVEDHGHWAPAAPLDAPYHHASAIDWRDDARLLEAYRGTGRRLTVIASGIGRTELREDRTRRLWFATYAARVECVRPVAP